MIAPQVEGRRDAPSDGRARAALVALGLALEAVFVGCATVPPGRDGVLPTLVLSFAAALLYLAAGAVGGSGRLVLAFAVLFRVTLLIAPPVLTTDLARYAWEGRVTASGHSPYALAPDAPELAGLRDATWAAVAHRSVPAVYGPLAELAFAVTPAWGLKALFAVFDLGTLVVLARLLAARGLARLTVFYAWHPLVLVEVAGQGHLDALLVFFVVLAISCEEARPRLAALAVGLAAAVKYLPLLLAPSLRRWRAAPLVVLLVGFLPFGVLDPRLPAGVGTYAADWSFNATGHVAVEEALRRTGVGPAVSRLLGGELAGTWRYATAPARLVAAALVVAVALAWVRRGLERAAFAVIAATLLLAPAVHPWYFLWLVPFAVLRRDPALLAVTLAAPVAYEVLLRYDGTPGSWDERAWPRLLLLLAYVVPAALRLRSRS